MNLRMNERGRIMNLVPFANTDLGKFAEPVNTLIEKVSALMGGACAPYQIRRIAQAEVDASLIRTKGALEEQELLRGAAKRWITEELRKQKNIESITINAFPYVTADAHPEIINDDWLTLFFEKCRGISNEFMQGYWARVLAGEANSHGSFSRRAIEILSILDQGDAQLLSDLSGYMFHTDTNQRYVFYYPSPSHKLRKFNSEELRHLETLGLINLHGAQGWKADVLQNPVVMNYGDRRVEIEFVETPSLFLGMMALSRAGEQLISLSSQTIDAAFWNATVALWSRNQMNKVRLL